MPTGANMRPLRAEELVAISPFPKMISKCPPSLVQISVPPRDTVNVPIVCGPVPLKESGDPPLTAPGTLDWAGEEPLFARGLAGGLPALCPAAITVVVRVSLCEGANTKPAPTPTATDTRAIIKVPHGAEILRTGMSLVDVGC